MSRFSAYSSLSSWLIEFNGGPVFFYKLFSHTVSRCEILVHLPSTNALIRRPGGTRMLHWSVVVPPFMSEVICLCIQSLQKLSVSLMRSLMRLSPWTSNQGQGLRRIMKSPISPRSMGCFSLLHSMLTESSIILSTTAGPQSRDNTTQAAAQKRHYRWMTWNIDTAVVLIILSAIFFSFTRKHLMVTLSCCLSDSWDTPRFPFGLKKQIQDISEQDRLKW